MNNELKTLSERKIEFSKEIIDYFTRKHVDFKMETRNEDDSTTFQFDFNVDGIPFFSIWYDDVDSDWCFNSIYELLRPIILENFDELINMFESDKGIFTDIIAPDDGLESGEIDEIHLYRKLDDDEFSLSMLDEIYDYFQNKTQFAIELGKLSEK